MNAKRMRVSSFLRMPCQHADDEIQFEPGVNIIVGPQNSGKTKLLSMLDYLMGDTGTPEASFGGDLAAKYDSAQAVFIIAGEQVKVERRWKEPGARSKVFVNDAPISAESFSAEWLKRLGIPILHFPQGNPYGTRAWPTLGWRTLLRHVYRQQLLWGNLADKQPDSEQHACITQFLGIAESLFSNEFAELVNKQKRVIELRAAKEQFMSMLHEVSKDLLQASEIGVALTADSITSAIERLTESTDALRQRRTELLLSLQRDSGGGGANEADPFARLSQRLADLQSKREQGLARLKRTEDRLLELEQYRDSLNDELSRLDRAKSGAEILGALKVTHCPACDQAVKAASGSDGKCFLCGQSIAALQTDGTQRLEFEIRQIQSELREAAELIAAVTEEQNSLRQLGQQTDEELQAVNDELRPARAATSAILPPEVSILDMEIGKCQEQQRQLGRIRATLGRREQLSSDIDRITEEASLLEAEVARKAGCVEFEKAGDVLSENMNTYLNAISAANAGSWTKGAVTVSIKERTVRLALGGTDYKGQLGGTLMLYFLFAYHFGLLALAARAESNYPGYLILDFPAELEEATSIADKENFVLEPFVPLTTRPEMTGTQVIAAGRAFANLQGVHRIELANVW